MNKIKNFIEAPVFKTQNADRIYTLISCLYILPIQKTSLMHTSCHQCHHKDDLINKYLKLIKLLKTKCDKSTKSFLKNNTLPSDTLYQTSHENSESLSLNFNGELIKSNLNPQKTTVDQAKECQLNLALMIMSHRAKTSLLKHSFTELREYVHCQQQPNTSGLFHKQLNASSTDIKSLIEQTLANGKFFHKNSKTQQTKTLHSQIFHLQIKNDQLKQKITLLKKQLSESQKRFMKEMEKKRDSLQTFGQEIRQKTEMVAELQYTIKQYETALGSKLNKPVGNVLDEDLEELKVNCQRLESVNEKLNNGVKTLEQTVSLLSKEVLTLKKLNSQMKQQNEALKQNVFDLSHQLAQKQQISTAYTNLLKKLNQKLQAIKLNQKHMLSTLRVSPTINNSSKPQLLAHSCEPIMKIMNSKMVSTKNTESSSDEYQDKMTQIKDLKQLQAEQKIEEIFGFLFNIREQRYTIENEDIFDEDQKELLKSHKQIFLNQPNNQSFLSMKKKSLKQDIKIDQSHFMKETNQVFYPQNKNNNDKRNIKQNAHQDSFLCVFEPSSQTKPQPQLQTSNKMKLIQLQIQKSKLIQKISQLKNLQMHIRNVVLNLMKSIDLSASRPETLSILEVVFDFFEYSEDEKAAIFKDKKKKFWGFM